MLGIMLMSHVDVTIRCHTCQKWPAQIAQSPGVRGFVHFWWSRGDLNPRPPALRYRFYMRSHLY